ncbi:MAG: hypothetical protein MJA29_07825, partial [Candidatus Omnitrophica bacterium]|nr:hypothetical protein [Candidatus Omnitrophota bacterium]
TGVLAALALFGLIFEARSARAVFLRLADALETPSKVKAEEFQSVVARLNRLEKEIHRSADEILEAALEARKERERVEQTLSRAWKRIERGQDGESAIAAEAAAYGIVDEEGSGEEGVQPVSNGVGSRGEGKYAALLAKHGVR